MRIKSNIQDLLNHVVKDCLLLTKETTEHLKKYKHEVSEIQEIETQAVIPKSRKDQPEKLTINLQNKLEIMHKKIEMHKSVEMQFNSNFLYAFTLFEKFISDLVRLNFKRSKPFREKYKQRFRDFAKSQQKTNGNDKYIDMLIDENLMIENFDELHSPVKMLISILDIDTTDSIFEKQFHTYLEARERRNLLTHRGRVFDKRYVKCLENSFGKKRQILLKFMKNNIFENNLKDVTEFNGLIGESANVHPLYFVNSLHSLIFLMTIIHSKTFKVSQKTMISEGITYASDVLHQNLVFAIDNDLISFAFINYDIWNYLRKNIYSNKFADLGFIDQVNYCLLREYTIDIFNKAITESKKEPKVFPIEHRNYLKMLHCNNHEFTEHYDLAVAYFEKDNEKFIKAAKKIDKNLYKLKDWFIFKRLKGEIDKYL
ncbi:MAG: hypothetical protein ACPH02_02675 [Amylibacter sp.]